MPQPSGYQRAVVGLAVAGTMLAGACAEPRLDVARAAWGSVRVSVEKPTKRPAARLPLQAIDDQGHSSALVLARLGQRRVVLVADEDSRAVRVVEPDTHQELSHVRVPGKPSQLLVAGDGRAYVALKDASLVVALEVTAERSVTLEQAGEITTSSEPVSLAMTPRGNTLLVASAWGKTLALYHLDDLSTQATIWLPREPRAVVVSADGQFAYVSHAVGASVSRVAIDPSGARLGARLERSEISLSGRDYSPQRDPGDPGGIPTENRPEDPRPDRTQPRRTAAQMRVAAQGFAIARLGNQTIMPLVLVHPDRGQSRPSIHGSYPAHQPALAMIDTDNGQAWLRVQHRGWAANRPRGHFAGGAERNNCFLPRAVAIDAKRRTVLIACLGSDEIVAYDASQNALVQSWRGRWTVPSGPLGIAIDTDAGRAWVWSQFDSALSTIELPHERASSSGSAPGDQPPRQPTLTTHLTRLATPKGGPATLSTEAADGRKLFHNMAKRPGATSGRYCASCHPDGRQDGLTWPTAQGPRRTTPLAGRVDEPATNSTDDSIDGAHRRSPSCPQLDEQALTATEVRAIVYFIRTLPKPTITVHGAPSIDSDARMATGRDGPD